MTYWIAEHISGRAHQTLRFLTREEFDEHVKENDLRNYVRKYYDLPRQVTVEAETALQIIEASIHREVWDPLPWEKK